MTFKEHVLLLCNENMVTLVYTKLQTVNTVSILDLISAVGVTDIYSRKYMPEKEFFACGL